MTVASDAISELRKITAELTDAGVGNDYIRRLALVCGKIEMVIDAEVIRLALDGLAYDGEHHKQWHLEQILLYTVGEDAFQNLHEQGQWERGIAP